MYKRDYTKAILLFLLLFSMATRIFALFFVESISHPQTWEYEKIANNLLEGKGFHYTYLDAKCRNTSMVLYSLICATIYYFTQHSFLVVKIFQILLSVLTCFLIYKVSKRIFGNIVGLTTLTLMSFHPGLIVYSVKLHALTLDTLLFILSIYFLLFIVEGQKIFKNSLFAGLSIGAALLTRATIGLFIPIALLIIIFKMKGSKDKIIRSVLGMSIGILFLLSPLIIRNYLIFHKIVILPNDSGVNFWTGNNPNTIGTANMLNGKSVLDAAPEEFLKRVKRLDEFAQNKLFYQEAWGFIKRNPQRFLILFAKKLYYFWWFSPTQGLNYPKHWLAIYKSYYSIILLFTILGLLLGLKIIPQQKRQMAYMVILFVVTISIAQALYYVDGRHRWAIEPFILIFSACGINLAWAKLNNFCYKIIERRQDENY